MEALFMMIVLAAFVVGLFAVLLCLSQVFDREGLVDVIRGLPRSRFKLWQMMAAVAVCALALLALSAGPGTERILATTILALCVLAWFFRNWRKEFVYLMGLRDEDFPGRHDKLIWVGMLLALAPIGVWTFRAYRLAHWPEPAPAFDPEHRAEEVGGTATQPA
jgi:hypothetical protein